MCVCVYIVGVPRPGHAALCGAFFMSRSALPFITYAYTYIYVYSIYIAASVPHSAAFCIHGESQPPHKLAAEFKQPFFASSLGRKMQKVESSAADGRVR